MSIKKYFKKYSVVTRIYDYARIFYYKRLITSEKLLHKRFRKKLGRELNLKEPEKYNDKLQWLKLNWSDDLATQCADKYGVREIINEKIGSKYLNNLIGVYDSVEEINIEELPDKFVLKGTHGSGHNIICKNKNSIDWDEKFKEMERWLRIDYYWPTREIVYKNIKPRIICEEYLESESSEELKDYRFFCFNGEPKFITVDFDINNKEKTRRNLYDINWNLLDAEISYPRELEVVVQKPEKLEQMLKLSEILSSDFPHARVDFYYMDNRIIFGEITFFHQGGYGIIKPEKFEKSMGDWLKLPPYKENL